MGERPLRTPDGRYLVVRGRLWRATDPRLGEDEVRELTHELMAARRAKGVALRAGEPVDDARARVDAAKVALGERGPVWWDDGEPDLTRHLARTTRYADWFAEHGQDRPRPLDGGAAENQPDPTAGTTEGHDGPERRGRRGS